MSPPANIIVTGGNRGIGLELVKQYLKTNPKNIIATTRQDSKELNDLAKASNNLHILLLDVADTNSFVAFSAKVGEILGNEGLNLLINNSGVMPDKTEAELVTLEGMREAFEVNCIGPLFLTKALMPHLNTSASNNNKTMVVMMSSFLASISGNNNPKRVAYRASKAALNMVMKNMSNEVKEKGIIVVSMHPGHVQTDMGGPNGAITTETCCTNMVKTLAGLIQKDNGTFLRYDNAPMQW